MEIFIGNLNFNMKEEDIRTIFERYGKIISANIVVDKDTGISKGFGFVLMEEETAALKAIEDLNGKMLKDRILNVRATSPKQVF